MDKLKNLTNFLFLQFQEYLLTCMNKLEDLYEQHRQLCCQVNVAQQNGQPANNQSGALNAKNNNNNDTKTNNNNENDRSALELTPTQQQNSEIKTKSQSGTPTDVQDVKF